MLIQLLLFIGNHLLVCSVQPYRAYSALTYTLDGKLLGTFDTLEVRGLDVYQNHLFLLTMRDLIVMDQNHQVIHRWVLPSLEKSLEFKTYNSLEKSYHFKVDQDRIYLTIIDRHQIYVYDHTGQQLHIFGKSNCGGGPGEFHHPRGVTCDHHFLYICDWFNHRIQVLDKLTGVFLSQWGKSDLCCPNGILLHKDLLYVTDSYYVQMFTKEGVLIQRIGSGTERGSRKGEFHQPRCVCIVNHRLYVSDHLNSRIQALV